MFLLQHPASQIWQSPISKSTFGVDTKVEGEPKCNKTAFSPESY